MPLSSQRKIYLGLLGLGVAALVCDRVFFAPAAVEASPADDAAVAAHATPAPARTGTGGAAGPTGKPLSARLAQANATWNDSDIPDAFHPRMSWIDEGHMGPPVPDTPEARIEAEPHPHKLSGIVTVEDGTYKALIDMQLHTVGDTLDDGLIIMSISRENGVELRSSVGMVRLELRPELRSHP